MRSNVCNFSKLLQACAHKKPRISETEKAITVNYDLKEHSSSIDAFRYSRKLEHAGLSRFGRCIRLFNNPSICIMQENDSLQARIPSETRQPYKSPLKPAASAGRFMLHRACTCRHHHIIYYHFIEFIILSQDLREIYIYIYKRNARHMYAARKLRRLRDALMIH